MAVQHHAGGAGSPVVLLHGLLGSGRVWAPVIDAVAAEHVVHVPTLAGHRGGPSLEAAPSVRALVDDLERRLLASGVPRAHLVGNSLGGWIALELAARGRALSVVALSPAGGWARQRDLTRLAVLLRLGRNGVVRHADRLERWMRRPAARRWLLRGSMERGDLVPPSHVVDALADVVGCDLFEGFARSIRAAGPLQQRRVTCPTLIAWAQHDRMIPFEHYGRPVLDAIQGARHVTLPGVGHVPMFDDPEIVAATILEHAREADAAAAGAAA